MKIKFIDSVGNELDFNDPLIFNKAFYPKIELWGVSFNSEKIDKFGVSGSFDTGDLTIKSDSINVSMYFIAQSDTEFRRCYNTVGNFFKPQNRPFYIVDTDNALRAKIRIESLNPKYSDVGSEHRMADATLKFSLLDALWETSYETTQTNSLVAPDATFTINTKDVNVIPVYDCLPVFTITSSGFNPSVAITNLDTDVSIQLADSNFTTGSVMTVDSNTGLISLGSNLKSSIKTGGYFLKLIDGVNNIRVQCLNNLSIVTSYRRRYIA
jgi:hypothetical protein